MKIDGSCYCGHVTFEADADPGTTTICNCTDCQTMSGAPLRAVITTHPGKFVLLSGKPTEYRKTADSGNVRLQAFCPQCVSSSFRVALAARHAVPAIYEWREFVQEGGLAKLRNQPCRCLSSRGALCGPGPQMRAASRSAGSPAD
jgi:hypothetical protein